MIVRKPRNMKGVLIRPGPSFRSARFALKSSDRGDDNSPGQDKVSKRDEAEVEEDGNSDNAISKMKRNFLEPRIDDPGLPLADSLISGAIAPMCVAYFTLALGLPRPMWLVVPTGTPSSLRGLPFLGPTFCHGAVLASCWLAGALAARAFEEPR